MLSDCLLADSGIIPCADDDLLAKRYGLVTQAQELLSNDKPLVKLNSTAVFEEHKQSLPPISEDVLYLEALVYWQRNLSAKRFLRENREQIVEVVQREKSDLV